MVVCACDSSACMVEDVDSTEGQHELERMEAAVQQLLVGVGEDPAREGLIDTPRRVAKAWMDMTRGYRQECKSAFGTALFHEPIVAAGSEGLVIVRDITFAALSESTLLPFHGRCHIAYVPRNGVVLGLSKLARVTKCLAARLQTQQQFTQRLVAAVQEEVQALGVAAVVQAVHLGTGPAPGALSTNAAAGCFTDPSSGHLLEFLALLRLGDHAAAPSNDGFTPALESLAAGDLAQQQQQQQQQQPGLAVSSSMAAAANTLLQCVGEDPQRKGLSGGAARYASWLASATAGYRMQLAGSSIGAAAAAGAAAPAVAELGPPTPDEQSLDPSDASSDDMSADLPWYMAVREVAAACGGGSSNGATQAAHSAQQQQQRQQQEQQQQQQEQEEQQGAEGLLTFCAPFSSQCEHHLLPFYGRLKLVYLPARGGPGGGNGAAAADLSTDRTMLAHIVDMYSKRLQVQERLTHQVADAVAATLGAQAVLVVVESAHMCMVARGVEKHASTTLTTAARGPWAIDPAARAAAMAALLDAHHNPHAR